MRERALVLHRSRHPRRSRGQRRRLPRHHHQRRIPPPAPPSTASRSCLAARSQSCADAERDPLPASGHPQARPPLVVGPCPLPRPPTAGPGSPTQRCLCWPALRALHPAPPPACTCRLGPMLGLAPVDIKAPFTSQFFFQLKTSHRIFRHMHEILNVGEKKSIARLGWPSRDESNEPT